VVLLNNFPQIVAKIWKSEQKNYSARCLRYNFHYTICKLINLL